MQMIPSNYGVYAQHATSQVIQPCPDGAITNLGRTIFGPAILPKWYSKNANLL